MIIETELAQELRNLEEEGLLRRVKVVEEHPAPHLVKTKGRELLLFCSNNYLGLTHHPKVREAAKEAIERFGTGSGASPLISGTYTLHRELEEEIAAFKGTEAAILFPSGYAANIGIITSLVGKGDLILLDKLNHASLIDGARLSGAKIRVYPHRDAGALERILHKESESAHGRRVSSQYFGALAGRNQVSSRNLVSEPQVIEKIRRRLIVTDGIFSMDGDIAPLPEITELAERYDCLVMVDDAHATGVIGKGGRGTASHFGLEDKIDIRMGTLSKALAAAGGFAAGSKTLIEYLRNKARSYIYSTALPPSTAASALAALRVIREQPDIIERLWENTNYLRQQLRAAGLNLGTSETPIIPIILGDVQTTMGAAAKLYQAGILVLPIRPPSVPKWTSRLRLTLMATHSKEDIDRVITLFPSTIPQLFP
ncbi:MAG: 8-amino-7-oxononanoate synthase [bacterium]|nr:8-amino-7-oxononanoate synthase [bacterium]